METWARRRAPPASVHEAPPRELHALRPDRMAVIPGAMGWPVRWGYRVGSSVRGYERDPLTDEAPILHLKAFHPLDAWQGEPSSGETVAAWRTEILDGAGAVRRVTASDIPDAVHQTAAQIVAFGAPPAEISLRGRQVSARYGLGRGRDSLLRL